MPVKYCEPIHTHSTIIFQMLADLLWVTTGASCEVRDGNAQDSHRPTGRVQYTLSSTHAKSQKLMPAPSHTKELPLLACIPSLRITDVGRRHETPGSKMKRFLAHSTAGIGSFKQTCLTTGRQYLYFIGLQTNPLSGPEENTFL